MYDPDTLNRLEAAYKQGAEILRKDDGFDAEAFACCVFRRTSQKAGNLALNNKVSVAIASETQNAYKVKALSLSGIATKIVDRARALDLQLLLFRAVSAPKRFAPMESVRLAVYSIAPAAIYRSWIMRQAMAEPSSKNSDQAKELGKLSVYRF